MLIKRNPKPSVRRPVPSSAAAEVESARMSGEDRRQQLIKVAMLLFSQKGFTGTTTKEIAAAANVNEAIIFRHFATKDDLYAAILDYKANEVCSSDWVTELQEFAARRDDVALFYHVAQKKLMHHARDENDQFLRLMFYSALEGHTLAHVFLERHARPLHEFLCDYVRLRQREGAFRRVHPRIAVNCFIGALNHHILTNAFFKNWRVELTDEEIITNHVKLLLHGLHVETAETMPTRLAGEKRITSRSKRVCAVNKKVKR